MHPPPRCHEKRTQKHKVSVNKEGCNETKFVTTHFLLLQEQIFSAVNRTFKEHNEVNRIVGDLINRFDYLIFVGRITYTSLHFSIENMQIFLHFSSKISGYKIHLCIVGVKKRGCFVAAPSLYLLVFSMYMNT